jgi:hypothetical protein
MQNKLNNQEKNDRANVGKINNGTCVVLLYIMQRFSDKTNPLENLTASRGFGGGEYRARTGDLLHAKQEVITQINC